MGVPGLDGSLAWGLEMGEGFGMAETFTMGEGSGMSEGFEAREVSMTETTLRGIPCLPRRLRR